MKSFALILLFAIAAGAQTSSGVGFAGRVVAAPLGAVPNPGGRTVTGMPYSAQQITEHVQTLADGTRITQTPQKTMLYRDSLGRTRTERTVAPPPGMASEGFSAPGFIEIFDPVGGNRYTLDTRNHTARQMPAPRPLPQPAPANAAVLRPDGSVGAASLSRPPNAAISPAVQAQRPRPQISVESLGTQTMEGVLVQGERRTTIYPEGFFGNDRPITSVSEIWRSPELNMVVLSKSSDPRSGESTTRLTNISRAEPDPSLFQAPPDYQILNSDR